MSEKDEEEGEEDEEVNNKEEGEEAMANQDDIKAKIKRASEQIGMIPPPAIHESREEGQGERSVQEKNETPLKSPDEEMMDEVYNELIDGLPKISGADRVKVQFAIDLIKDNPSVMLDPANLYLHIKQTVPRVNDYLLHTLIDSIFSKINAESPVPAYPFASDVRRPSYTPQPYAPRYQGYGGYGMYGSGSGGMGPYQNPNADLERQAMLERLEQMRQKHELEMEELKQRIAAQTRQQEEKIPVEFNGKTIEVPASLAPLYLMLSKPKEDDQVKRLEEKLDELQKQAQQQQTQQLMERIAQLQDEIAFNSLYEIRVMYMPDALK